MKENEHLQELFSFTNSANVKHKAELEKLKNQKAYGQAKKIERKNRNRRKLIKGIALVAVVTGLLVSYGHAYNQTVESKIDSGEIAQVLESYSPTAGPDTIYKDSNGDTVNISFGDVIENVVDSLSDEKVVSHEELIQQPIENFASKGDTVPSDEVLTQRLVEGDPDE